MSTIKRIVIFSITYDPFIGGAEVAIKEVTNRLPDFEFDLFTARLDSSLPVQEKIGNVNIYRVGSGHSFLDKIFYPWRASRLALKMHKQNPYNIIHAVMATYAGWAALKFKDAEPEVPYLLTLQSGDSDEFIKKRTWFWKNRYKEIYTKANKITAISNWLSDRARKYGYKKDISIIPNGVDYKKFDIDMKKEERTSIRESWGAKENDFVLITTSRLVHKNGIDILIDAMEFLPDNVRLVIAGEGKDEKELRGQSSELQDRVKFLGYVGHDELPRLLKSADMFVRPSRSEGMGNSFVEAKIAGLPVLGTKVGGILDLIDQGIVEPIEEVSPKSVAGKIKHIKDNPYSDSRVKEIFNWNYISNQYQQEYQKLISARNVKA